MIHFRTDEYLGFKVKNRKVSVTLSIILQIFRCFAECISTGFIEGYVYERLEGYPVVKFFVLQLNAAAHGCSPIIPLLIIS